MRHALVVSLTAGAPCRNAIEAVMHAEAVVVEDLRKSAAAPSPVAPEALSGCPAERDVRLLWCARTTLFPVFY